MRKYNFENTKELMPYTILACDDEQGILDSLSNAIHKLGYNFIGTTNPNEAIKIIKEKNIDLLILDFLMVPIHGDKVVEEIRKFNKSLYILLLTRHKDLAPPLDTIKKLDIQGYCEKTDKFDQLILLIESGIKSIKQLEQIKEINLELEQTNKKLEKSYLDSIEVLRQTVEAKDSYTRGHSERVSKYSVLIGKKLNLSQKELDILKIGRLFHDIGKIGVPDAILQKQAKLTPEEFEQIKRHPIIGQTILATSKIFQEIIPIVKYHHERYDGTGYPENLKGEEIPYLVRITSIADSFDAMASRRSYRDSLSFEKIREEFQKNKEIQFDPVLVDVFLDIFDNEFYLIEEIMNN